MSAIQQEIAKYIKKIPDSELEALKPLLKMLAGEKLIIETDLTGEERAIIAKGREEYKEGGYIPLDRIDS